MKSFCPITGKVGFPTRMHAEIRILSLESKAGHPLYSYRCEHCDRWHLTKTPNFEAIIEYHLH